MLAEERRIDGFRPDGFRPKSHQTTKKKHTTKKTIKTKNRSTIRRFDKWYEVLAKALHSVHINTSEHYFTRDIPIATMGNRCPSAWVPRSHQQRSKSILRSTLRVYRTYTYVNCKAIIVGASVPPRSSTARTPTSDFSPTELRYCGT